MSACHFCAVSRRFLEFT